MSLPVSAGSTGSRAERGLEPVAAFHDLVRRHFRGQFKPPFNTEARAKAGMNAALYAPLAIGSTRDP